MSSFIHKALNLIVGDPAVTEITRIPKNRPLGQFTERDLIRMESEIGAEIFGALSKGHRREFFCLDASTWIWYEEWIDDKRKLQSSTIRYEVSDNGVLKVQEGARYSYLEGQEYQNFALAVQVYYERVMREIYHLDPSSGESIA